MKRSAGEAPWDRAIKAVLAEESDKKLAVERLFDPNFQKQTNFIRNPARKKVLFCTRRASKSYTAGLGLFQTALEFDEVNCLYLGLTRASAKGILWKDVLKQINRKHQLRTDFNGSELTATTPNGSIIHLTGVDASDDDMHKLLGKKYKLVILDEAQSYHIDLRTLIYGILGPTVIDQGGAIWMMGTAGNLTQGLFYDVTTGKEPGWNLFEWTAMDNPHVAKQWAAEIEDIKRNRPLFMETALFKQWYLNQWVIDEDAKVYKFNPARNLAPHLPRDLSHFHYVLGLDLAHSPDSTALVVGAYHEADPTLYIVYAHKETKLDITGVAGKVKLLQERYPFEVKVVDGANKQAVAELNNRHGLNLIAADKTGKADFIKLMNDDFVEGKIKLLPDTLALYNPNPDEKKDDKKDTREKDTRGEYQKLVWLTDANGKVIEPRTEHPNIHNDAADAALYLWRFCYQYLFQPTETKKVDPNSVEAWEPKHLEALAAQVRKEQNQNELELEWDEAFSDLEDDDAA